MSGSLEKRQEKQKAEFLELLKKTPIIQLAAQKSNIARATFYRWKQQDPGFAAMAEAALSEGESLITELAESKLIGMIQEGNVPGVFFWLKNHHPKYTTRVELTALHKFLPEKLTAEQAAAVTQAVELFELRTKEEKESLREPDGV